MSRHDSDRYQPAEAHSAGLAVASLMVLVLVVGLVLIIRGLM